MKRSTRNGLILLAALAVAVICRWFVATVCIGVAKLAHMITEQRRRRRYRAILDAQDSDPDVLISEVLNGSRLS